MELRIKQTTLSAENGCGHVLFGTQYYVNGKRKSEKTYWRCYSSPEENGYRHVRSMEWFDTSKRGIFRHHILNVFEK